MLRHEHTLQQLDCPREQNEHKRYKFRQKPSFPSSSEVQFLEFACILGGSTLCCSALTDKLDALMLNHIGRRFLA